MVEYICTTCGKISLQKGHHERHLNRKTPCKPIKNKIIEKKVEEKLNELSICGDIEIKSKKLLAKIIDIKTQDDFVLYSYEVSKIKLFDNEYIINYQYYDGDYSWIKIVNIDNILKIGKKLKKNLISDTYIKNKNKIIRLTKIRNKNIALEFNYNLDTFIEKYKIYKEQEKKSTNEYLQNIGVIDDKRKTLYVGDNVDCNISMKTLINNTTNNLEDCVNINGNDENHRKSDNICTIRGDCNENIKFVKDRSIQTISIDPPYNIGKDTWDNIDNYNEWLTDIVVKLESKLRDNGSMFIFHNDMQAISELMVSIKKKTKLKFVQMITWNKRYEGSKKKGFLDGYVVKKEAHKWELMAEYILFYIKDNTYKYKEARLLNKVCAKEIQKEVPSKTGGMTGWYGNIEGGLNHPTRERMIPITKHIGLKYEDVVPKFINQKTHHCVWNYDSAKKNKNCSHITPKPIDMLENIIRHTTDEGDILLDCFAGTGSLGRACLNTNRKCILIERDLEYMDFINSELF